MGFLGVQNKSSPWPLPLIPVAPSIEFYHKGDFKDALDLEKSLIPALESRTEPIRDSPAGGWSLKNSNRTKHHLTKEKLLYVYKKTKLSYRKLSRTDVIYAV